MPLVLHLSEVLGITARYPCPSLYLRTCDSASREALLQEQSRYSASAARVAGIAGRSAPCCVLRRQP
jgi:hypothetical protein